MASPRVHTPRTTVAAIPARGSNAASPAAPGLSHRSGLARPETVVTARCQTGPRTAAGKAAASRNTRTHGLLSDDPIATPYEQPAAWHAHRQAVLATLVPSGYLETVLAERLALLHWRLARVARHEAALIARDQFRLACESAERRHTGPDCRPSTAAELEAERSHRAAQRARLSQLAKLDGDADLVDEDAHDLLQALLAPYEDPERLVTLLRDALPDEDLAAYCVRRQWTAASLQDALAPLLAETHETFAALCAAALNYANDACAELDRSWSDEEIAVAAAVHNLPTWQPSSAWPATKRTSRASWLVPRTIPTDCRPSAVPPSETKIAKRIPLSPRHRATRPPVPPAAFHPAAAGADTSLRAALLSCSGRRPRTLRLCRLSVPPPLIPKSVGLFPLPVLQAARDYGRRAQAQRASCCHPWHMGGRSPLSGSRRAR